MNDSTLHQDVWQSVRTLLVSTSDPIKITNTATAVTTQVSIVAAFNDTGKRPQIVIVPITVSESNYKFGGLYGQRFIDVTIECYGTLGVYVDQMADQVDTKIRAALPNLGMELVAVTTDYSEAGVGENKNHLKSLTFSFDRE